MLQSYKYEKVHKKIENIFKYILCKELWGGGALT